MVSTRRLKEVSLFKDFSQEELEKVSSMMKESFYPKGSVVWDEDSPEQGLQVIDYGKVRVSRRTKEGNKQILAVLKQNNFFGELSILDGRSHSASVEAVEDTKVMILAKSDMDRLLAENPHAAYKIVREMTITICEILREMNNKFIKVVDYIWE
ncbi:MAG: cyclic nucleotide-binding domain-containing protein [Nitrospirae bacterium]|nr:cyclic nucleotide-binding domain-containing protein [Nitrospirota bacterium]